MFKRKPEEKNLTTMGFIMFRIGAFNNTKCKIRFLHPVGFIFIILATIFFGIPVSIFTTNNILEIKDEVCLW